MNVSVSKKEGRMSLGSSAKVSAKVTNARMWSYLTSFIIFHPEGNPVGRMK